MVAPGEFSDLSRSLVRVPGSGSDRSAAPSTCDLGCVSSLAATVPINPKLPAIITNPRRQSTPRPPTESETTNTVNKLGMKSPGPMKNARTRPAPSQPYIVPRGNERDQAPQNTSTTAEGATTTPFPAMSPVPTVRLPAGFFSNKQGRITTMTTQELVNRAPNILHVNTQAGPVLLMPVTSEASKLQGSRIVTQPSVQIGKVAQQGGVKEASTGLRGPSVSVMTLEQILQQQDSLRQKNVQLQQQVNRYRQLFRNPEKLKAVMRQLGIKESQD